MIRQKFVAAAPGAVAAVGPAASKTPWPLIALPARSRNVVTLWAGHYHTVRAARFTRDVPPGDQLEAACMRHVHAARRPTSHSPLEGVIRWVRQDLIESAARTSSLELKDRALALVILEPGMRFEPLAAWQRGEFFCRV